MPPLSTQSDGHAPWETDMDVGSHSLFEVQLKSLVMLHKPVIPKLMENSALR